VCLPVWFPALISNWPLEYHNPIVSCTTGSREQHTECDPSASQHISIKSTPLSISRCFLSDLDTCVPSTATAITVYYRAQSSQLVSKTASKNHVYRLQKYAYRWHTQRFAHSSTDKRISTVSHDFALNLMLWPTTSRTCLSILPPSPCTRITLLIGQREKAKSTTERIKESTDFDQISCCTRQSRCNAMLLMR
jgi:hypothetical protein